MAVRARGSTPSIRLNFASESVTPNAFGSAPPDNPVPAPRATMGTFRPWQASRIFATCHSASGTATARGSCRYAVSASHS